ncbi:MAG TPA: Ig-like domain-containing protein [Vicinamibacterales bacterium]|nr:Ig-like domain-containing protein [Vicinamibacterales bacterium]
MSDARPAGSLGLVGTVIVAVATLAAVLALADPPAPANVELANRIPEAAPYVTEEAALAAPPFEEQWQNTNHPSQCRNCHTRIFDEWNGSMMANAWRDPAWRAAFLLSARQMSTSGNCEVPAPPDGTARAQHNPFADAGSCASRFDLGDHRQLIARSGSLLDGTCSRCHMPTNYVDNVPIENVFRDAASGLEHGGLDVNFNPTSDNATGLAFATLDAQLRNTASGKSGVQCMVCHSLVDTRSTPYHNSEPAAPTRQYHPGVVTTSGRSAASPEARDIDRVADAEAPTLGYGVGGGAFRLSPRAILLGERLGPLFSAGRRAEPDAYLTSVFKRPAVVEPIAAPKHPAFRHVFATRSEFCATCHDVTNPLTVKNRLGHWVGGFPIERTYAEWSSSRYADRPGNGNFDPAFKRDCQTCHMQQDYGHPGTAQTLYEHGEPIAPLQGAAALDGPTRTHFSHHFVGGNAYVPGLIGGALDESGNVEPYPELSVFSFSSANEKSVYHNAYWMNGGARGAITQQARLAWERLRNVLDLQVAGPPAAAAGTSAPITVSVANTGSGHNFPTGFPEGRAAWLAISAFDLATGRELPIHDAYWNRTSIGVGRLTRQDMIDPSFPRCDWKVPAGSADPYAYQFKAVATLGDGCPTLDLVYASAPNLVTNADGMPVDDRGAVIDGRNPRGLPRFRDVNGNGDPFDDSFLRDTRLRPMPHAGATVTLNRYSVVIPPGTTGPIAITAAVYYQSLEAIVAKKFLGNLADTDTDFLLEPCVLGGPCDGRHPSVEPPVVEGAPPVPMEVRNWVIRIEGAEAPAAPPAVVALYPRAGATDAYAAAIPKASFSAPVSGIDRQTFVLADAAGTRVPASVHQIGDGTWGLFPDRIYLKPGARYTARLAAGICTSPRACTTQPIEWTFTVAATKDTEAGDTTIPAGFQASVRTLHTPERTR